MRPLSVLILTLCLSSVSVADAKVKKKTFSSVVTPLIAVEKVNDAYQADHSPEVNAFWDNAVYFTGNMEAYKLTGNAQYLEYSDKWARHNQWQGATETDPSLWLYKDYGEDMRHVLFGDWQICFQTYLDMYATNPDDYKWERAKEVVDYMTASGDNDYWWWVDALYMAMPVMAKMYGVTGDTKYLDKLCDNLAYTDSLLWDEEEHLYYRDAKYVYPEHTTDNGLKDFWARGNGWALAGLAKVIACLPQGYSHNEALFSRFIQLAEAAKDCQQEEGYWTRSLIDPGQAEGPETSGTALITYALLYGINNGLLSASIYQPTVDKAWSYLVNTALQADGTVGYVQPIGEKAIKGQTLSATDTSNFGTGAFLLAACEKTRFDAMARGLKTISVSIANNSGSRRQEVAELSADSVCRLLRIPVARLFRVVDNEGREAGYQLTRDGKLLIEVDISAHGTETFTIETGSPSQFVNVCYGRMYPERLDDIAWENDRGAYRCYGPSLQQSGEEVYGIDVWVKNTPSLVVEKRYHKELAARPMIAQLWNSDAEEARALETATSYHHDHGDGLDCYTVGPSLGCGAPALMEGDDIVFPYCYKDYELIDNGPLRFTVSLVYNAVERAGDEVTETRLISLDKGSHFCKMRVGYDGMSGNADVGAGVVIHADDTRSIVTGNDYVAYADPTDNPQEHDCQIYVGAIFPDGVDEVKTVMYENASRGVAGHALGIWRGVKPDETLTYYFGAAWSQYDCASLSQWQTLIDDFKARIASPLVISYK